MAVAFDELRQRADARWQDLTAGPKAWIRVGGGVSGEAAGCDAVIEAFEKAIADTGAEAVVSRVGMLGLCYAEPLVDITMPGGPRVYYANVESDQVAKILDSHVIRGQPDNSMAFACSAGPDGNGIDGVTLLNDLPDIAAQTRIATRNFGRIDPADLLQYIANGTNFALITVALT